MGSWRLEPLYHRAGCLICIKTCQAWGRHANQLYFKRRPIERHLSPQCALHVCVSLLTSPFLSFFRGYFRINCDSFQLFWRSYLSSFLFIVLVRVSHNWWVLRLCFKREIKYLGILFVWQSMILYKRNCKFNFVIIIFVLIFFIIKKERKCIKNMTIKLIENFISTLYFQSIYINLSKFIN